MPSSDSPASDLSKRILADPPAWARQPLAAWSHDRLNHLEPFLLERTWSDRQSVNLFEVRGTAHPDYQGWSWLDLLQNGKRMRANLALWESNPGYYLEDQPKRPPMYFLELDGAGLHVGTYGNHRTCIGRFAFHLLGRTTLHGATLERYRCDHHAREAYYAWQNLIAERRLPLRIDARRGTLAREDTAGWMRETYATTLALVDLARGRTLSLTPPQAEARLRKLRRAPWWRRAVARLWKG